MADALMESRTLPARKTYIARDSKRCFAFLEDTNDIKMQLFELLNVLIQNYP